MANITLYKDFYQLTHTAIADTYVAITPFGLSANTFVSGSTALTETLVVENESIGRYYVDLNPLLYSYDYTYELQWSVLYTSVAPSKMLIDRFRINPSVINAPIDIEIDYLSQGIDIEIVGIV